MEHVSKTLDLPLIRELVTGGIDYATMLVVEFEPQSCWYDAAFTMVSQAIQNGVTTDIHLFQHNPVEAARTLSRMGLDVQKLQDQDSLRIIDSYTVQIGTGVAQKPKGSDAFKTSSVRVADWSAVAKQQITDGIPQSEKGRLHIDDNLTVLNRYNKEDEIIDYWRTSIIPLYKARQAVLVNPLCLGVASDSFYKQFESLADGIIDFKVQEEEGRIQQYVRVRTIRGKECDTRWQRIRLEDGQIRLDRDRLRVSELRDTRMRAGERRLAAIMFTDMVGYASLAQQNEHLSLELLEEQRSIIRSALPRYRGKEVKTIGDAFLVVFPSALEATRCAIDVQRAMAKRNSSESKDRQIGLRVGIHVGDILEQGDDVAGDGVNIASRIEPLAQTGGICVSRQVYDQIHNKLGRPLVSMGVHELKHIDQPVEVYNVILEGVAMPPSSTRLERRRIAVLPLSTMSQDAGDEYFTDGMTEELISTLSKIAGFRIIARTSVMKYKGSDKSIAEIGKELGVSYLLEGSVRKAGNRLRINAKLIEAESEEPIWSQEYDRDLLDVFSIQTDIAHRIAEALKVEIMHIERRGIEKKATSNLDAYNSYLKGRYFWNKRTQESLQKAIEYFEQSLAADPEYVQSYTGIADSYAALALLEFMPPREAYPKAKEAAEKALALDDSLAEAHTSLGLVRYQYEWDWHGAEDEFNRAIQLNPSYAPAHHFYADYLKAMGRFDEALTEIRRAQELDPLSLAINTGVGHVLYLSRKYDGAIEQYRRTVELDQGFVQTHLWFGRPYLQKEMYNEALEELQKAVSLSARSTIALGMLGHAYASAGEKDKADAVLEELEKRSHQQYVASYWIATIYNGFRNADKVFEWLGKAYDERSSWLVWINVEPRLDWLRSDPRFVTLLKNIGFK